MKKKTKLGGKTYTSYGIHEVFYDKKGNPISCTQDPVEVCGDNKEDIMLSYLLMGEAFNKPVLDYSEIGKQDEKTTKRPTVRGGAKKCTSPR